MTLRVPHPSNCICSTCRPADAPALAHDLDPRNPPALLPGGLTPAYGKHRFCKSCLAITVHSCAISPRASCLQCDTTYSQRPPTTPHGAALWASAQAEIEQLRKNTPPVIRGKLPVSSANSYAVAKAVHEALEQEELDQLPV